MSTSCSASADSPPAPCVVSGGGGSRMGRTGTNNLEVLMARTALIIWWRSGDRSEHDLGNKQSTLGNIQSTFRVRSVDSHGVDHLVAEWGSIGARPLRCRDHSVHFREHSVHGREHSVHFRAHLAHLVRTANTSWMKNWYTCPAQSRRASSLVIASSTSRFLRGVRQVSTDRSISNFRS